MIKQPGRLLSMVAGAFLVLTGSAATGGQFDHLPQLQGKATAIMSVNGVDIVIELHGDSAPVTAGNFVDLVDRGFYNGQTFGRVERTPQPFVAQAGTIDFIDPQTKSIRYVPLEILPHGADHPVYSQTLRIANISAPPVLVHAKGAIAMSRSSAPDSGSSKFYIALTDLRQLDGDYAVFGYVTETSSLDAIQQGARIDWIRIVQGFENLRRP